MILPVWKNDGIYSYSDKIPQGFFKAVMGEWSLSNESPLMEDPAVDVSYYEAINFCNRFSELYQIPPTYMVFNDGSVMINNPKGPRLLTEEELRKLDPDLKNYKEWVYGGTTIGEGLLTFRVGCLND